MAQACNENTVMIAGSAPSYTHGVIDPIEELGRLALEKDIWLHVDGCVGGIILPFFRKAGQFVEPFDFSVPGVCSLSADLHKHGYTPLGVSTIWIRNAEMQKFHHFRFEDWPNGLHRSPIFNSSRSASPLAAAWATMLTLGENGYVDLAARIIRLRDQLFADIRSIPGLYICGNPNTTMFTYSSDTIDTFAIGDGLAAKGWYNTPTSVPVGQHLIVEPTRDEATYTDYARDLRAVAAAVLQQGIKSGERAVTY
jgi:sphinganine-1-phosphate aldolase